MLQMQYFIAPYMTIYLWTGVVKIVESTADTDLKNRFLSKGENSSLKPIEIQNEI